jgi:DNA helicase-2/ATP-dependent DNA helicase PcrA
MENVLENLNERQQKAVVATDGPVLIIAGPGSGKTKVLTHRIAYIIGEKKINPTNILAVTFTNKAAQEMKTRVGALLKKTVYANNSNLSFPVIGTFHNICVRILRQEAEAVGYKKSFVIYDDDDQISIVKKIMKELQINTEQFNPRAVLSHISNAKNELKDAESFSNVADGYFQEQVSIVYNIYQKKLRENNALDFDDLIMQTILLFLDNAEILRKYQNKFQYVMVDEYQDTNYAQYRLVDLLSKTHRNLCVVGDDWQSIYKWRGADIRNILDFEKNYSEAEVILLEQNYRSTKTILDASYQIISRNVNRKEKKLWSEKEIGDPIVIYEAADEKGEAEFIVSEIAKLTSENNNKINLKDIAILYRTNAQSRSIEEAFLKYNLPYKIVGGIKFYLRKEIKDIIAYLRLIQNPSDTASLERIINVPKRDLGQATFKKVMAEIEKSDKNIIEALYDCDFKNIPERKIKKIKNFAEVILKCQDKINEIKISELLSILIKNINYEECIKDGTEEGERRWENVKELFSAVEKYDNFLAEKSLPMFLEEIALATDLDKIDSSQDTVTLMTLHSAKGLEFEAVFIIGMEEGLLPHSRSVQDPSEMEEERRLCYVGITRAKRKAYLIFARTRKIYGSTQANMPSRFISDIPENLAEFKRQEYNYLGEDEVIEVD